MRSNCSQISSTGVYYPEEDEYKLPVIVMEKMQFTLRQMIEKYRDIPITVKLSVLDNVCQGLMYLHSRRPPIIHRDLTPNNVLLGGRLEAKITDLGVAKGMTDNKHTMTKVPGTYDFMPPEATFDKPDYDVTLDAFSFGGVILCMITQQWPTAGSNVVRDHNTDSYKVVSEVDRRKHYIETMTGEAAKLRSLVVSCLENKPKNRPSLVTVSEELKNAKDQVECQISPLVWWNKVGGNKVPTTKVDTEQNLAKKTQKYMGRDKLCQTLSIAATIFCICGLAIAINIIRELKEENRALEERLSRQHNCCIL